MKALNQRGTSLRDRLTSAAEGSRRVQMLVFVALFVGAALVAMNSFWK
jgi:hypothetical protein